MVFVGSPQTISNTAKIFIAETQLVVCGLGNLQPMLAKVTNTWVWGINDSFGAENVGLHK